MYENTWSGDLTQHILSHEYPKAKTKHSEGTRRLTNPVYTSGLWRAKSVRLQPPSLDRKGLVTQAKDCDPSNNLLDPLFVLAGERGRARAIAIAPTPVERRRPPRRSASEARAGVERRRPPRRIASEARAGVERRRPPRRIASEARASNDVDPRGALRAKREPQPPSPQAPSPLQRARPGEVRKEGRGDGLKSNSSLCDKALPVQRGGL
jgi:hypothetical protein